MSDLQRCNCGLDNIRTAEFCRECGTSLTDSSGKLPGHGLLMFVGKLSGWALMIATGVFVLVFVSLPRFPGDKFIMVILGAVIWFGICQAFRNNNPLVMRVLKWLFPYDSWTAADN
jgi:hypothetical protein